MKSTTLIFTLFIASIAIGFVQADNFITIAPFENSECNGDQYGMGYSLPVGTCFQLYNQWVSINYIDSNTQFHITTHFDNCSDSTIVSNQVFPADKCTLFSLNQNSSQVYYATLSTTQGSIPKQAIDYKFYYYSYYCSGPTLSVYYTNGYIDKDTTYQCVDDTPYMVTCDASGGDCNKIKLSGCNIPRDKRDQPWRVDCKLF